MKILVLGDSHTKVFQYIQKNNLCKNIAFDVILIGGATAQGMVNPNSKTNAMPIFCKKLKKISANQYDKIIIMLGEVDCGFVIWLRSEKYGITVDEQINTSINNLFTFIKNNIIHKFNVEDIILCGSILPTIKDNTNKSLLGGARAEVKATQYERTLKTLEYNNILKSKCIENGYKYIDITTYTLDTNSGVINKYYLSEDISDHHLSDKKTNNLWLLELNNII
jgi:hypothetical protein